MTGKKDQLDRQNSAGSPKVTAFKRDASFYFRRGEDHYTRNEPERALFYMNKAAEADPGSAEIHFTLGCLLSRMDRLQESNLIFKKVIEELDPAMIECYFYLALNHSALGDYEKAKNCLLVYLNAEPEGARSPEAEEMLAVISEESEGESFNRVLNCSETEAMMQLVGEIGRAQFKRRLLENEQISSLLEHGLYQGGDLLKEAILRLFGEAGGETATAILAEFASNPWVSERLRQVALQGLKRSNPSGSVRLYENGTFEEKPLCDCRTPAPLWQSSWQRVLEITLANMRRGAYFSEDFYSDAEAIWVDFINRVYPAGPRVSKAETWAAGLEYALGRFHFLGTTQKDLAHAYGVSPASVQRKFNEINRVLHIDRKAYRNMLAYVSDWGSELF